jgi:ankyrin repeat protein
MTNAVGHEHDAALRRLVTRGNIAALEARIANEPTILERLGSLDDQGVTMLHHAAEHGQVETMRWLVNRCGVLATARDVRHGTALLEAAPNGQIAAAEFLVNHGVDVNDSDARGDTALHVAAGYGQLVMMKWLVKRKALVDARTVVGVTPLHYAAAKGRTEVCKVRVDLLIVAKLNTHSVSCESCLGFGVWASV